MSSISAIESSDRRAGKRQKRGLGLNIVLSSFTSSSPNAPPARGPSIVRFTQPDDELHKALQRQSPSLHPGEITTNNIEADMELQQDIEEEAKRLPTAAYIASRIRKARESVLPIPQLFSKRITSVIEALQSSNSFTSGQVNSSNDAPSAINDVGLSSSQLASLRKWEEILSTSSKKNAASSFTFPPSPNTSSASPFVSDVGSRNALSKKTATSSSTMKSSLSLLSPEKDSKGPQFPLQSFPSSSTATTVSSEKVKNVPFLQVAYDNASARSIELLFKYSERVILNPRLLGSTTSDQDHTYNISTDEAVALPRFSIHGSSKSIQGFVEALIDTLNKDCVDSYINDTTMNEASSLDTKSALAFSKHSLQLWQLTLALFSTTSSSRIDRGSINTRVLSNVLRDPELELFARESEAIAKESLQFNGTSSSLFAGRCRVEALSQWLQRSLSLHEKKDENNSKTFGDLFEKIFDSLTRRNLLSASRLALSGNQPILSSLVTQGGTDKNVCVFLQRQLRQWRASSVFSRKLLSCYSVLAGPDEDEDGISNYELWLSEVKGAEISWLQSFGLFLWYSGEDLTNPDVAIARYTAAVERNLVSAPLPWWRALEPNESNKGGVLTLQQEKKELKQRLGLPLSSMTQGKSDDEVNDDDDILHLSFTSSSSSYSSDLYSKCISTKVKLIHNPHSENNSFFISPPRDALYMLLRFAVQGSNDADCLQQLLSPYSHCPDEKENRLSFLLYTVLRSFERLSKFRADLGNSTSLRVQAEVAARSTFNDINNYQQNVLQQLAKEMRPEEFEELKISNFQQRWDALCLLYQSKEVLLSQPLLTPSILPLTQEEYIKFSFSSALKFEESNNNWPRTILSLLSAAGQALEDAQVCSEKDSENNSKSSFERTSRVIIREAIAVLCRNIPSSSSLLSKNDSSYETFSQNCNYLANLGWPLPHTWLAYAVALRGVRDASIQVALPALISLLQAGGGSPLTGLVSLAEEDGGISKRVWALRVLKSLLETEILPNLLIPLALPSYYAHLSQHDLLWQSLPGGVAGPGNAGLMMYVGPGGCAVTSLSRSSIFTTNDLHDIVCKIDTEVLGSSETGLEESWNKRGRLLSSIFSIGSVIKVMKGKKIDFVRTWATEVFIDEQDVIKRGAGRDGGDRILLREMSWPTSKTSLQRLRGLLLSLERRLVGSEGERENYDNNKV
jgi:hypothetical protein